MLKNKRILFYFSVFIAILFHICGWIGMQTDYRQWFISMTPLTLIMMTILALINDRSTSLKALTTFFAFGFFTGLCSEIIGVNTGLLFGNYFYGTPFGFKIFGVPVLIGVLWLLTVSGFGHLTQMLFSRIFKSNDQHVAVIFLKITTAALLVTLYDYILEPGAIFLGYWQWLPDGVVPFFNYLCWFFLSGFILVPFFMYKSIHANTNYFVIILMIVQVLFFLGFQLA